jgi:DNA repair protein RadA/Sms
LLIDYQQEYQNINAAAQFAWMLPMLVLRITEHAHPFMSNWMENTCSLMWDQISLIKPELVVVDSIQTIFSSELDSLPGSISQIRECGQQLLQLTKQLNIAVIIIGHVTKEGIIAGPKMLEHMVDTVLQFEGDRHHVYRILRTVKNRFGSASELGVYEMGQNGLREVNNPSEILI